MKLIRDKEIIMEIILQEIIMYTIKPNKHISTYTEQIKKYYSFWQHKKLVYNYFIESR